MWTGAWESMTDIKGVMRPAVTSGLRLSDWRQCIERAGYPADTITWISAEKRLPAGAFINRSYCSIQASPGQRHQVSAWHQRRLTGVYAFASDSA